VTRTELERTVQPSLLDRLTDEERDRPMDASLTREESERRFRLSVQRDVEWLLNTRRTMEPAPLERQQLRHSVYDYGLPDTIGVSMATPAGREALRLSMQETIARFEPRLGDVRVRLMEGTTPSAPQVRFVVEALLRMDPSPEQVVFDTVFEVSSGEYAVGAATGA
jgi:type VI secretion system protein ImpF